MAGIDNAEDFFDQPHAAGVRAAAPQLLLQDRLDELRSPADARIGRPVDSLDTPTLLLDRDICDANLELMARFFQDRPASLRPHFKNHKCVTLARRQLALGAKGITCAKLGEAEVLVAHGINNVLVANQVAGPVKMQRLARLSTVASVGVAVDCEAQVAAISEAVHAARSTVDLLIELDIGMGRCGVADSAAALRLAESIQRYPAVRLAGLQAFEGHLVNVMDRPERQRLARSAMLLAVETKDLLARHGIAIDEISGSSSSTYDVTGILPGVTEVQAGSYATMDRQYRQLAPEFGVALSILVQVISRPRPDRAVLDLGVKGAGGEFGVPELRDYPDVEIPHFLSEEHLVVNRIPADWKVGQTLQLIPSHACTTCNLYRELVIHQHGVVVDVWPIEAAGLLR